MIVPCPMAATRLCKPSTAALLLGLLPPLFFQAITSAVAQAPQPAIAPSASAPDSLAIPPPPFELASSPQMMLWLRDGSVLRGELVEYAPGQRILVRLATDQTRTVAWTEIKRLTWLSSTPITSATPPASLSAAAPVSPTASTRVELITDRPGIWLEQRDRLHQGPWIRTCDAPCTEVSLGQDRQLRIAGPGLRPSNPFHLPGSSTAQPLVIRPGSQTSYQWGLALLSIGIPLGIGSGAAHALGQYEDQSAVSTAGIVGMAVGGAMILSSIPLLMSGRTTVRDANGQRVAKESFWPLTF